MTPAALRVELGEAAAAELEKPPQLFPVNPDITFNYFKLHDSGLQLCQVSCGLLP